MLIRFFTTCLLVCCSSLLWAKGMVVSIHPLYLIAQDVTKGIEKPELLLSHQSGHDVQLTPENRKSLQNAEFILWLGQAHEAPLGKILTNSPHAVSLLDSGILTTLPMRDLKGQAIANTVDTHVWLEPGNAIRIAYFIAAVRSKQHPEYKDQYWNNARNFAQRMTLATKNFGLSKSSYAYWTYHDAYQYAERSLNLNLAGTLTADPHMPATIAQIKYLNDSRPYTKMCLLAEGEASDKQYQKLQPIQFQAVDESLNDENDFIDAWTKLAKDIQGCIQNTQK